MAATKNGIPWGEDEALFQERLARGEKWERYIFDRLKEQGLPMSRPPKPEKSSGNYIQSSAPFRNHPDMLCGDLVVEVKSFRYFYRGPVDYPFEHVMIDTVSGHDQKNTKPFMHITVSTVTGCTICLPGTTRPLWYRKRMLEPETGVQEWQYFCHRRHWLTFEQAVQIMKEKLQKS